MDIVKEIGLPAVLEQTAEECMELGHSCLKLARKLRDENPTPREKDSITSEVNEEWADVALCADLLVKAGIIDLYSTENIAEFKTGRWEDRIKEHKVNKENV